ncbi:diguanylate cyclase [Pseudomonas sp. BJa5]|uniref:sensor domain-containing diguanylate cyclase n=1 Tax=Pseudomonas sp. BJa5 TaxID=2936270 RepID=UPI0025595E6B|nr:sensor domain-containing diguanylate cyclase [Pseudomonas sp. BGr12]MDL2422878.1 sensor domain-containing diguanylate cyclase [Pseudomonas sp. BGr12]
MSKLGPMSIGLRGLILSFVLLAVLATLCNSLFVAWGVQRDALVHSALEANRAYAFKVASSITAFLTSVHERMSFSSQRLGRDFSNAQLLKDEAMRLQAQDTELNTVLIVDANGRVVQNWPEVPAMLGTRIQSEEIQQALAEQRPLVSHAYTTLTGQMVVAISQPIFSPSGQFLGVIAGSVFIQQRSVLHTLIGNHYHQDGTVAFVADEHRRLLYHTDITKVGELLTSSPTIDAALRGESGAMEAINYQGIPVLAGYAQVADANWTVVSQLPRELALAPLGKLMRDMLVKIIPAGVLGLLLILLGTMLITRPLRQLANSATQLSAPETTGQLQAINAWYAEAAAIRAALLDGVQLLQQKLGRLKRDAQNDPLTGLANRRAMNKALETLDQEGRHYAALALDIDRFKRVNDTFGHDIGDLVLKQMAAIIQQNSREDDLACRAGGEEFVLLLPDTSLERAGEIAERIRQSIASTPIEPAGTLTISIGVACRSEQTPTPEAILKCADELLYRAKQEGRNRVVVQA